MARHISDLGVRALRGRAERYEQPAGGVNGLYIVVQPSGAKSWALRYRFAGRTRKLTLPAASRSPRPARRRPTRFSKSSKAAILPPHARSKSSRSGWPTPTRLPPWRRSIFVAKAAGCAALTGGAGPWIDSSSRSSALGRSARSGAARSSGCSTRSRRIPGRAWPTTSWRSCARFAIGTPRVRTIFAPRSLRHGPDQAERAGALSDSDRRRAALGVDYGLRPVGAFSDAGPTPAPHRRPKERMPRYVLGGDQLD